jgi:hypothetical protein
MMTVLGLHGGIKLDKCRVWLEQFADGWRQNINAVGEDIQMPKRSAQTQTLEGFLAGVKITVLTDNRGNPTGNQIPCFK